MYKKVALISFFVVAVASFAGSVQAANWSDEQRKAYHEYQKKKKREFTRKTNR